MGTLEAVRVEFGGVVVAVCSCCAVTVRISPEGRTVHASDPKTDISGHLIDGP